MAVAEKSIAEIEGHVVLHDISWPAYEALVADVDSRRTQLTYFRGNLEIMTISGPHERIKKLLGKLIDAVAEEWAIPIRSAGSTTFKSEGTTSGLEADESYYIAHESLVRGRDEIDLAFDPPPDLAVEIDLSASSVHRFDTYAGLGVPEVWRYAKGMLTVYHLKDDGTYQPQLHSLSFPSLPLDEVQRFLDRRNETDETAWIRSFRTWMRTLAGDRTS